MTDSENPAVLDIRACDAQGEAIDRLLEDPTYRANANRIRESMGVQPSIDSLVPALEALTESR